MPGNNEAAVIKTDNIGVHLVLIRSTVNQELTVLSLATGIKPLAVNVINIVAVAILTIRMPGHDKTTILKIGDLRIGLLVVCRGVNQHLFTNSLTQCVVDLRTNVLAAAFTVAAIILPGDHIITTRKSGHRRIILITRCVRVNANLAVPVIRNRQCPVRKLQRLNVTQAICTRAVRRSPRIRDRNRAAVRTRRHPVIGHVTCEDRRIRTRTAINCIVTRTTGDHVTAGPAINTIRTAAAGDHVTTRATCYGIVTRITD